jgi:hypothetical protein
MSRAGRALPAAESSVPATPYRIATPAPRVRLSRLALKALGAAPGWAQRLIGGKSVAIDGQRLHPEIQLVTRLLNAASGEDLADLPVERGRAVLDLEASIFGGKPRPCDIESITIPTDDGSVPARLYRPLGTRPRPRSPWPGTVPVATWPPSSPTPPPGPASRHPRFRC